MLRFSEGTVAIGLLAIFAFWLFAVLPFLYGPPPRFAEVNVPAQEFSEVPSQQTTRPDGSANAPFFIRVPKTAKEEALEAQERREKTSADLWMTRYTGAVAAFTLALVIATVMLYLAGRAQLAAIKDEFISSHRPRLIVREAYHNLPAPHGISISIFVVVANVGETAATVAQSTIGFDLITTPRYVVAPRSTGANELGVNELIQPGESHKFTITSTQRKWNPSNTATYAGDDLGLFLTGHIVYEDERKVRRQLAFWRKYNPITYRFARVVAPGDEYEYSD